MTLPSELLGLIEAYGDARAKHREARPADKATVGMEVVDANANLIAGIERYREEGQEAAARVAEDWGTAAAIAGRSPAERMTTQYVAQRIAETIRSLHPTPLEEPKT